MVAAGPGQRPVEVDVAAGSVHLHEQEGDLLVGDPQPPGEVGQVADVDGLGPHRVPGLDVVEDHLVTGRDDGPPYLTLQVGVGAQPPTDLLHQGRGEVVVLELVPDAGPAGVDLVQGVLAAASDLGVHGQVGAGVLEDGAQARQIHDDLLLVRIGERSSRRTRALRPQTRPQRPPVPPASRLVGRYHNLVTC